jgi:Uma2 family endonuclease
MSVASKTMTVAEFLALPDDGVERALIRGEVREYGMTTRNRLHAAVMARLAHQLLAWLETQSPRLGEVFCGDGGCILPNANESVVGIDVAYFDQATLDRQTSATTLIAGAPVLAVEVLSPSDTQEHILEKVDLYLSAGTALVWLVEPRFRTITVYRSDAAPELFHEAQTITAAPHLPGLAIPVAKLFA